MGQLDDKLILVVDDEAPLLRLMLRQLTRRGVRCIGAPSGNAALAALDRHEVDVVVSDIRMPDGTGVDLLRGLGRRAKRPIAIVVTGFSDESAEQLVALGARAVLPKPMRVDELIATIAQHVAGAANAGGASGMA
ncbi:MAG: response regulator [Polyangiaceae bacterium]